MTNAGRRRKDELSTGEPIGLAHVPLRSDWFEQVWELYRKNSATLGFLPRGALEEFAHAGCVIAAVCGEKVLGYVAWRISRGEAVLVHLCVDSRHRGGNCSDALMRALIEQCRGLPSIRLRCRKDYDKPNRLWPRYGFSFETEVAGRGTASMPLFAWRRTNQEAPIFRAIKDATPRASQAIAIDANVFFDLIDPAALHHEEAEALLADWIDDAEVCVTQELRNEVSRQSQDEKRRAAQAILEEFTELAAHPDKLDDALTVIGSVLPEPVSPSDESDRRQLAHAMLEGARFFATRDRVLLDHADELIHATGVLVLRPSDVVARLQGDSIGVDYAPIRLHGTKVEKKTPASEEEMLPFQQFAVGETKSQWLALIRKARQSPERFSVELIGVAGSPPRVAISVDRLYPDRLHIWFLRTLSGSITSTLLKRAIADVLATARGMKRSRVTIDAPSSEAIRGALEELGFQRVEAGQYGLFTLPKMVDVSQAEGVIRQLVPKEWIRSSMPATDGESSFWPLKILNAGIETYIVPIRDAWAAALFDTRLAEQSLFHLPEMPALALENVYFSASKVNIPAGSRILWYVSRNVGEVRAVSICLGTEVGSATSLSRKYHRLGAYDWPTVLRAAKGDPDRELRAYRFEKTELLEEPVPWKVLERSLHRHTRTSNKVPSPLRVPEGLFVEIYRHGMRFADE